MRAFLVAALMALGLAGCQTVSPYGESGADAALSNLGFQKLDTPASLTRAEFGQFETSFFECGKQHCSDNVIVSLSRARFGPLGASFFKQSQIDGKFISALVSASASASGLSSQNLTGRKSILADGARIDAEGWVSKADNRKFYLIMVGVVRGKTMKIVMLASPTQKIAKLYASKIVALIVP